jgi:hypothetical protein
MLMPSPGWLLRAFDEIDERQVSIGGLTAAKVR